MEAKEFDVEVVYRQRAKVLVCLQRQRVRVGERGEIRLYCTAEYLDELSAELQ
jgi:hypothetical protein